MAIAYIALGSNLKQPETQLQRAFSAIAAMPHTELLNKSSLYRTAPIGYAPEQLSEVPDFINAVVKVSTTLPAEILLDTLLSIEHRFGRERPYRNAPRVLDLDLLMYDNITMNTPQLTLPHPRMHERGFVMLPLAEIAPEFILPNRGSVVELARQFEAQGIQKL
jgi:2-amino-4-hydroxy-6-hydroxymethyldihydropteridine diphosphokinase